MTVALAPRPFLTPKQKLTIMARYCHCPGLPERGVPCGRHLPAMTECEFDHIHARALGGSDEIENYRPLCQDCHSLKTFGRRAGAAKTATTAGADANRIAKVKRLERARLAQAAAADAEPNRVAQIADGDRGRHPETIEKRDRKSALKPRRGFDRRKRA